MFRYLILFWILTSEVFAQTAVHKYFIHFTDKTGTPFSLNNPSAFLSQKAIERRLKSNIQLNESDLPVNPHYVDSIQSLGAVVFTRSKWFNGVTIECDSSVLNAVVNLSFVRSINNVFRYSKTHIKKEVSNGVSLNRLQWMKSDENYQGYGNSFNQIHLMNGEFLHDIGFKGEGMRIAVIDDGFYSVDQLSVFEKTRTENRILGTWDFVSNEASVYEDDTHGMSVLSTIAGYLPGQLIGTAPEASFYLLRSEDDASENIVEEYNWNAAAEYADSAGADIISSSLGYTEFDDSTANHVYADMDGNHCPSSIAADMAASKGMLVLTSAGNSGNKSWRYIGAPSDGDSVLSVGAIDSLGIKASFSSFGPASDGDIKPNVMSKGAKSTIANTNGGVSLANGTSFSCPILAGAAACLWQRYPGFSAMEIKKAIEKSSSIYLTPNDSMGYGIPDFRVASYLLSSGNVEFPEADELLGIYPNPFSDLLHIRFFSSVNQQITVEVFNELGQILSSSLKEVKGGYLNTIDLSMQNTIGKGVYLLRIVSPKENFVKTLIRQ